MATDLDQILLVIVGTVGGIFSLLFLLAAIDPQTDKTRPVEPQVVGELTEP